MCPTPPSPDWLPLATFTVQTGTLIGAAAVAVAALWQAGTARRRHEEQTTADRERRITESFAKAVELLGSDKRETRIGAVYTLERISKEKQSEHDYYWPIMETLTAFVRERAPGPSRVTNPFVELQSRSAGESTSPEKRVQVRPATDIQTVLTVLGRRDEAVCKQDLAAERRLDLANTDLRGANLRGAHLEGALLVRANLERAWFDGTRLERATLSEANLEGAYLAGAHLERATLSEANLEGATLSSAHLNGANLQDAYGLTQQQVNSAYGDAETRLPKDLKPPARWPSAVPEEPDNAE